MGDPKKHKPLIVGQRVFVVPQGNMTHHKPFYTTVKRVGNKLFELTGNRFKPFSLKTFGEDTSYVSDYQVYLNKLEYDNKILARNFTKQIVNILENRDIDVNTLGKIGVELGLGRGFLIQMEEQYKDIG